MPFAATWMGLESVTLSEVSYREEEISNDIPDMWTVKRNKQMNLVTTQKETHRLREQTYGCQEEGWGKDWLWSLEWTCISSV